MIKFLKMKHCQYNIFPLKTRISEKKVLKKPSLEN